MRIWLLKAFSAYVGINVLSHQEVSESFNYFIQSKCSYLNTTSVKGCKIEKILIVCNSKSENRYPIVNK